MVSFLTKVKIEIVSLISGHYQIQFPIIKLVFDKNNMMPMRTASTVVVRSIRDGNGRQSVIATTPYFTKDQLLCALFKYTGW